MKNTFEITMQELQHEAFVLARVLDLPYTRSFNDCELVDKINGMSYAMLSNFVEVHRKDLQKMMYDPFFKQSRVFVRVANKYIDLFGDIRWNALTEEEKKERVRNIRMRNYIDSIFKV